MAYDGWIEFNGVELVNLSRTAQLAEAMNVTSTWLRAGDYDWIEDALGGTGYEDVTQAPWYDAAYPASGEFAGVIVLGFPGLGDSTKTANVTEYVSDGGTTTRPRAATLTMVASVALVAATDRGAEFGKRWLDSVLGGRSASGACIGSRLEYFRYADVDSPKAHYRDVRLTRGCSITRRFTGDCSVTYLATFTVVAGDPYEYGEMVASIEALGAVVTGPGLISEGDLGLVNEPCPEYDYTPIYDPLYPALVAPPTSPAFYPAGWEIEDGSAFTRYWAIIDPIEPANLSAVPIITLASPDDARMVRVGVWPSDALITDQCDPLFSVVVSYMPGGVDFIIDGEQKTAYVWDGAAPQVRRTDSLVYSPDARPVDWASFTTQGGLLVTLDLFDGLAEDVEMALNLMSKSN